MYVIGSCVTTYKTKNKAVNANTTFPGGSYYGYQLSSMGSPVYALEIPLFAELLLKCDDEIRNISLVAAGAAAYITQNPQQFQSISVNFMNAIVAFNRSWGGGASLGVPAAVEFLAMLIAGLELAELLALFAAISATIYLVFAVIRCAGKRQ